MPGENFELRADLNSEYRDKRKDAIKRVIANMTVGKDVSGLFPDVLKNMQTEDLEQKKLVYLYLMNYAKTQPELVILAVNTFVRVRAIPGCSWISLSGALQDSDDPNPLVRALAIRTMGCLRAEKIIDYLCDPLQKCMRDENPYVRKTAALCVAKLYDLKPELVLDNGFLEQLQEMVADPNPMVFQFVALDALPLNTCAGRRECCDRFNRHPRAGDGGAVLDRRQGSVHHHCGRSAKAAHCSERMLRVGPRRDPDRARPLRGVR